MGVALIDGAAAHSQSHLRHSRENEFWSVRHPLSSKGSLPVLSNRKHNFVLVCS